MAHGPLRVSDAIAHSCNIFMYQTGELVGVQGLCSFFDMAGVGHVSGTGLMEETRGINPTPSWLASQGKRVTPGLARLFAIGQAEVSLTPVQAANLMAVYASGVYRPVTLIRGGPPQPEWRLPVLPAHWQAIRSGLFRVTNEPGATAYRTARFVQDGYAMCGKTGSATVYPWAIAYAVPYVTPSGARLVEVVPANTARAAIERFGLAGNEEMEIDRGGVEPCAYWPPLADGRRRPSEDDRTEHAWFVAYLQAIDGSGQPLFDVTPRIAFSVLVEFGGSGGQAAGPIAAQVAETILDVLGPGLEADHEVEARG
jgi:cell division protein FtsI/penicillin-binding protein 2